MPDDLNAMSDLYHNRVLELAAGIPNVGELADAHGTAEKVSRICGSTVRVDVKLSKDGKTIEAIAVDPKACALGQASTSILSQNAIGARVDEIIAARDALSCLLYTSPSPRDATLSRMPSSA